MVLGGGLCSKVIGFWLVNTPFSNRKSGVFHQKMAYFCSAAWNLYSAAWNFSRAALS